MFVNGFVRLGREQCVWVRFYVFVFMVGVDFAVQYGMLRL